MLSEMKKKEISPLSTEAENHDSSDSVLPIGYKPLLEELKSRILSSQLKAATAVNRELIAL